MTRSRARNKKSRRVPRLDFIWLSPTSCRCSSLDLTSQCFTVKKFDRKDERSIGGFQRNVNRSARRKKSRSARKHFDIVTSMFFGKCACARDAVARRHADPRAYRTTARG